MTKAESDVDYLMKHYKRDEAIKYAKLAVQGCLGNTQQREHWTQVLQMLEREPIRDNALFSKR